MMKILTDEHLRYRTWLMLVAVAVAFVVHNVRGHDGLVDPHGDDLAWGEVGDPWKHGGPNTPIHVCRSP